MKPFTFRSRKQQLPSMCDAFMHVYENHMWSLRSNSKPSNFEQVYRVYLESFLQYAGIRSILDVGCGYFRWLSEFDWSEITYTGLDVVPDVIRYNIEQYENEHVHFLKEDATQADLPDADLLLIKDVLQHWPEKIALDFLPTIRRYKFALITQDDDPENQRDIAIGGCRPFNITKAPYSLPAEQVIVFPWYSKEKWITKRTFLYDRDGVLK